MASIDRTELLRLYRTLGPTLVLYARTWADAAGAQDAVQEAFVALFAARRRVENARAWLFVAVRRRAIDAARARRRRERREGRAPERPALGAGPGALADREAVSAALAGLGAEEREVVVLRIWGGLTFEEIGAIGVMSAATAFRRYQAALGAIRKALEQSCTRPKT